MLDLTYVLRDYPSLSSTAMLVYGLLDSLAIASSRQGKPYTYCSRKYIAERIHKCERTARRAVKELEKAGLVYIKRSGRGLNDRLYIVPIGANTTEKKEKSKALVLSKEVQNVRSQINTKEVNNNIDVSIYPVNSDNRGFTAPKGKPTNKRPKRSSKYDRWETRRFFQRYLKQKIKFDDYKNSYFTYQEDCEAVEKVIDLISDVMTSKSKISIGGVLLTPSKYWDVVRLITLNNITDVLAKAPKFTNVRNPRAYFIATLYNEVLHNTLLEPWYIDRVY